MGEALRDIFILSDAFGKAKGLSESSVSTLVLKGGNRLRDLRAGTTDIGVRRLETAIRWFSANWPDGAAWPESVPRPAPPLEPAA